MLVLASQSPRRAELLHQLQVPFSTLKVEVDESMIGQEHPEAFVSRLARLKATTGWQHSEKVLPVLGSDTIVVFENEVLGKPKDKSDALRMLKMLSGNLHQVMTSVAIADGDTINECTVITDVWFKELTEKEMQWYWETGEPCDKAGSYGIQGLAGQFVTHIKGSYSAVVGLPLYETSQLIQEMGITLYEC